MAAPCSQWIACSPVRKAIVAGRSTRSLVITMTTGDVSPRAARMGRFLLAGIGVICLLIGGTVGYLSQNADVLAVTAVMAIGFVSVWIAVAGSDKLCANLGGLMPWV